MNRIFGISLLLLTVLVMTPSSAALAKAFKLKPFVAPPGEPIKTIALLKIPEPRGYFLGEGGLGAAGALFGTPGIVVDMFKKPKHPEYEYADFRFSAVAERLLTEHLKAAGFNVISVPVDRKKPHQLLRNYKALSVPNVDAYLDVATGGVGYRKSTTGGWPFAHKVGPYVLVSVQLVSARSKKVLYADIIEYGWRKAHQIGMRGTDIDAPENQVFADAEAVKMDLMSGVRSRSIAQLEYGIDVGMRTIVSAFSSYPATVTPTPPPTIEKRTTTPFKVAIFPFASSTDCIGRSRPSHKKLASEVETLIKANDSLTLAYSYYNKDRNYPPIKKPEGLWARRGAKPNVDEVFSLGEAHGVDVVLMYWRIPAGWSYCEQRMPPFRIDVYVFDIKQKKKYQQKGREKHLNAITEQALSRFLAGRPSQVVATAPTEPGQAKNISQDVSAGAPSERISLPPGGSVQAIKAAATAYCGTLNKQSRLIAAPPDHPEYVFGCYPPTEAVSTPTPSPTTVANANAQQSSQANHEFGEIVIEVGVFIFLGSDFQVSYRPEDSPWMYGYRHLETEEDFVNEAAFGLPEIDSDREIISKSGPFVRYLFNPESRKTFYLSGALFKSTQRLECGSVTSEDSASSLYFGGGLMGRWNQAISYNVGILIAPGEDLITNTGRCASETEGGFDVSLSLVFRIG